MPWSGRLDLRGTLENWTHLWMQWAAVITHSGSISTPPHQWPMKPSLGCSSWRDTCQGHAPLLLGLPLKMRPVVVVVVEDETSSFSTCIFVATDRGCLCDTAGHPHSVIQSRLYLFNAFVKCELQPLNSAWWNMLSECSAEHRSN